MEPEKKSNGAFVGLVIIVIILVVGGIYIWQTNKAVLENNKNQVETVTDQDSADLSALELDASAIDTSSGVDASKLK